MGDQGESSESRDEVAVSDPASARKLGLGSAHRMEAGRRPPTLGGHPGRVDTTEIAEGHEGPRWGVRPQPAASTVESAGPQQVSGLAHRGLKRLERPAPASCRNGYRRRARRGRLGGLYGPSERAGCRTSGSSARSGSRSR